MADAKQKLQIDVQVKNQKALGNLNSKLNQTANASFSLGRAAKFAAGAIAAIGVGKIIKGFVNVGKEVESLNLRFKYLFGSAEEGALAFQELSKYAGQVPFSLGEIAAGSGNLATVAGDAKGLAEIMKITGNVAAIAGMDFKTTAEQIQRSFSAGISAADLFRDKGIKAMLGFKDGVKYTVEETQEVFKEAFGEGGIYATASDDFAKTFAGTLSMIGDTYRNFQEAVSGAFFEELKFQFKDMDTFLKNNQETITQLAEQIGAGFVTALKAAGKTIAFLSENVKILTATFITLAVAKITYSFLLLTTQLKKAKTVMVLFNMVVGKNPFVKLLSVVLGLGTAIYTFRDSLFGATEAEKELQKQTNKTIKSLEKRRIEMAKVYKQQRHDGEMAALALEKEGEAFIEAFNLRRIEESQNAMHEMMNTVVDDSELAKAGWKDFGGGFKDSLLTQAKAIDLLHEAGASMYSGLTDSITDFVMTGKMNFRDFANDVIRSLVRIATQAAITWAIKKAIGFATGIPFLAEGGPAKAGQPYIVGEAGPELFVPNSSGTVVPSGETTGAAIGGEVNVNFNINAIDAVGVDQILVSRRGLITNIINEAMNRQGRRFA
jgi:hypothetical protein